VTVLDRLTADRLRQQLRAIPELCAYAWLDLAPSTTVRYGSIHTARLHAPSPVNERILSLLGPGDYLNEPDPHGDQDGPMPVAAVLNAWARVVTGRRYPRIGPACAVLLERWPATTGNTWSRQLAIDIGRLHGTLEAAASLHAHTRTLELPCPRCTLFALEAMAGRDISCSNCGATMTPADYDRRAALANKIGA
jgi:hypothetical protein